MNEHFSQIEGRKAMVLFTDGVDTTSRRATYESTVRDAEELDALIYPVEFDTYGQMAGGGWPGGGGNSSGNKVLDDLIKIIVGGNVNLGSGGGGGGGTGTSREEYERGALYLRDLARVTGARLYDAETQNFEYAFRGVAEELRRQYSLGYYPKNKPAPGERRGIRVRVGRPEVVVRTRDSYVFRQGSSAQTNQNQPRPPVLRR
jgi:VWFA-related protein